jgi:hypothetical protein
MCEMYFSVPGSTNMAVSALFEVLSFTQIQTHLYYAESHSIALNLYLQIRFRLLFLSLSFSYGSVFIR